MSKLTLYFVAGNTYVLNYDDDEEQIEVTTKDTTGNLTEEANISDKQFIKVLSDDTEYYYDSNDKTKKKVQSLKVVLKKFCQNDAVVNARGGKYCEECYKKLSNVPKLSVIKLQSS